MKIEKSFVSKLKISEVNGLDPITVFLEDFERGKGRITISCYDSSWNSYWGAMGDRNIKEFFLSCDNSYLIKNLSSIQSNINDYETLEKKIKEHFKEDYEDGLSEIQTLYENIEELGGEDCSWEYWLSGNHDVISEVFGCEWWECIPTKTNPKYTYLSRIVDAVKEGLKLMDKE